MANEINILNLHLDLTFPGELWSDQHCPVLLAPMRSLVRDFQLSCSADPSPDPSWDGLFRTEPWNTQGSGAKAEPARPGGVRKKCSRDRIPWSSSSDTVLKEQHCTNICPIFKEIGKMQSKPCLCSHGQSLQPGAWQESKAEL